MFMRPTLFISVASMFFYTITTLVCWSTFCLILSLWLHSLCCDGKGSCVLPGGNVFMVCHVLSYTIPDSFVATLHDVLANMFHTITCVRIR